MHAKSKGSQILILNISYGELGSMIMHQTLYNMFPPSSFEPQSITPLTPQEFIQRILVPEAALALIMEDTGQDRARAVQTMRESAGYGVAMFPDTNEGPEVGAGEDIVLERARARRRELEDEERIDALLRLGDSEDEHATHIKGVKRPNLLSSGTTTDIEETTARRKMKRKKAGLRTDAESGPDDGSRYHYTTAASSGLAWDAPPPQSSPPPLSPKLSPRSTWTSSPEQKLARNTRPESRTLRSKGKSSPGKAYSNSRRGFASATLETCPPSTVPSSGRSLNGSNSSAPISEDDIQVIDATGAPSLFERKSPIQKVKPKPRMRMAKYKPSADRSLEPCDPVFPPTEQSQWRDSSVE